jgi:hypothetical protein
MTDRFEKVAQVHVRVPPKLKRAVKMYCASQDMTEQALILRLLDAELRRRAPSLWPRKTVRASKRRERGRR